MAATHGDRCAPSCREERGTATGGNSVALDVIRAVFDATRFPRKAIADEIGVSKQTLSKMEAGSQAFGLDDFEKLPRDLQVNWMKRYGKEVLGLTVRELEPAELTEEFLALVDRLASVARLARVGRPVPAKAGLQERAQQKVG